MKNKRLQEIKLAIQLNHIDKAETKDKYKTLVKVLSSLALALGEETSEAFIKALEESVADGFLGASNKEIIACYKKYFSIRDFSNKLNVSTTTIYNRYADVIDRDFDDEDFIKEPKLNTNEERKMIGYISGFIDGFKLPSNTKIPSDLEEERTLEIDFYIIYNKLYTMFRNEGFITNFIKNLCDAFYLDYESIINLKNNIHIINRSFPNFRYNASYFKQEIFTLFIKRGYKKGTIGTRVFGRESNYLYNKGAKLFNTPIKDSDLSWQFSYTIDWKNMDKTSVKKFIEILHEFADYDV